MAIDLNRALSILSLAIECHQAGRLSEALDLYQKALSLSPDNPDILLPLGAALHDTGQYADAVLAYQTALARSPLSAAIWQNMGNSLLELNRYEKAIESYAHAVALDPDAVDTLVTMGTSLEHLGKYDEALRCYNEAILRNPESAEAHWNRSLALLRFGDYEKGWQEFSWRWKKKSYTSSWREFSEPLWDGKSLEGRKIFINSEQAYGDTIQFARYLPLVAAAGGEIILECPAQLTPLLANMGSVRQVIATGSEIPAFDCHIPLMSLPLIFRTTLESIPGAEGYITPPEEYFKRWSGMLGKADKLRIGVVWTGRKRPDPLRSCRLTDLHPLFQLEEVSFYSLQVGEGDEHLPSHSSGMNLVDLTPQLSDFADTASLITLLDAVVTIDTSVAHLSGALGKPTFLLLPFTADWRWLMDRNDSPWYRSITIFRQKSHGCWSTPVENLTKAVEEYLKVGQKGL